MFWNAHNTKCVKVIYLATKALLNVPINTYINYVKVLHTMYGKLPKYAKKGVDSI